MANYAKEFEKRGVKLLGISCDDVQSHKEWTKDIEAYKVRRQSVIDLDLKILGC